MGIGRKGENGGSEKNGLCFTSTTIRANDDL